MNRYLRVKAEEKQLVKGVLDWFVHVYVEAVKPIAIFQLILNNSFLSRL